MLQGGSKLKQNISMEYLGAEVFRAQIVSIKCLKGKLDTLTLNIRALTPCNIRQSPQCPQLLLLTLVAKYRATSSAVMLTPCSWNTRTYSSMER